MVSQPYLKAFAFFILSSVLLASCAPAAQLAENIPVTGAEAEEASSLVEPPAADLPEVAAVVEEMAVEILLRPSESVPAASRTLSDSDSSLRAYENRVLSGDKFLENLYERPFTSREMIYQPDLDIYSVDFAADGEFFYFTINLNGTDVEGSGLNGIYGIEFDTDLDGRGEVIVTTEKTAAAWDFESISVFVDVNGDVGGPKPIIADAGFSGSGYDELKQIAGNEVAFARIDPQSETSVQIAVSTDMLGNTPGIAWSAWADNGLREFTKFDYNDTMGPSAAGSPFRDDPNYPIKDLYSVDNTCRLAYGDVGPEYAIPGLCIALAPTPEPGEKECFCSLGENIPQSQCRPGYWVCR